MLDPQKLRRIEVRAADGQWVEAVDMGVLEAGDTFRMFEPDGSPVVDRGGFTVWVVEERPFVKCRPEIADAHMMSPAQDGGR